MAVVLLIWRCTFSSYRSSMPSRFSSSTGILMVEIIRKGELPRPEEVPAGLRAAAVAALKITLREPRPAGFPLLFSSDMQIIERLLQFFTSIRFNARTLPTLCVPTWRSCTTMYCGRARSMS